MINFRTVFCLGGGLKRPKIILNNQTCSVWSAELEWGGSLLDVSCRDERPPEEPVHQENCQNTFQHNHRQEDRHLRIRFQKGQSFLCSYKFSTENGVPSSRNHFATWAFTWEWWHIFYFFWLKAELNCYSDLVLPMPNKRTGTFGKKLWGVVLHRCEVKNYRKLQEVRLFG